MPIRKLTVTVIGSGPAGHTAAIRAAQLGAQVFLVERGKLGGACLNWACIATKYMVHATDILHSVKGAARFGIDATCQGADWADLVGRKSDFINSLGNGLQGLLSANDIKVISGRAEIINPELVLVHSQNNPPLPLKTDRIIIASGSVPKRLNVPGAQSSDLLFPDAMLGLERLPKSLIMIGGGAVGVEYATIFSRLGCQVSILELLPHILPVDEIELTSILERSLKRSGVSLFTEARVLNVVDNGGTKRVTLSHKGIELTLESEAVAMGIGHRPELDETSLSQAGVIFNTGGIVTDDHMTTNIPTLFAAGDVTGKYMLAHVAIMQGKIAAENAMDINSAMDYRAVPRCVFSRPELAAVGLTEEQALSQGYRVKCGRSPFAALAVAGIRGERHGLVKIVSDADNGRLLGVHILGPDATGMIAEGVLAIRNQATLADIENTIHAHPTLSEAIWDAALDADDRAIYHRSG